MLILSVLDYGSCVPFRVLAGDFVLCSLLCPRSDSPHQGIFLSNHGEFNSGGNPTIDLHPIQGGVEILLVASCYRNPEKLRPFGPIGSYANLFLLDLPRVPHARPW